MKAGGNKKSLSTVAQLRVNKLAEQLNALTEEIVKHTHALNQNFKAEQKVIKKEKKVEAATTKSTSSGLSEAVEQHLKEVHRHPSRRRCIS